MPASDRPSILVTGGAGFIGSHTAYLLRERGYPVLVYDRLSNGACPAALVEPLVRADLTDTQALEAAMREHKVEAVIHFAASIEVGESVRAPLAYYQNNVAGSLALLAAMHRQGLDKLVFSSTAAVYGNAAFDPIPERAPFAPSSPYGHSKAAVEKILADHCATGALNATALRYFNAAGAAPDWGLGERHQPETHLIPLVIQAALGQREQVAIYGSDYPTPDGTCVRDYIHVKDLAEAHILALEMLLDGGHQGYRALNLGTGQGLSVRQIIEAVRGESLRRGDRDFPVEEQARRQGDPARLVADASAARSALTWHPHFSDLQTIVGDAYRFFAELAP